MIWKFISSFYEIYDYQIEQTGTSTGLDSNETNQADADDKLKIYFHYHSVYGHETSQDNNLPWLDPPFDVTWPFDLVVLQNYLIR